MFLVKEPMIIFGLIVAYLFIVIKGPKWMANRDGFELRKPLILYNFLLVALSAWMMYEVYIYIYIVIFDLLLYYVVLLYLYIF